MRYSIVYYPPPLRNQGLPGKPIPMYVTEPRYATTNRSSSRHTLRSMYSNSLMVSNLPHDLDSPDSRVYLDKRDHTRNAIAGVTKSSHVFGRGSASYTQLNTAARMQDKGAEPNWAEPSRTATGQVHAATRSVHSGFDTDPRSAVDPATPPAYAQPMEMGPAVYSRRSGRME